MQTSVLWADRDNVFTLLGQQYLEAAEISVETADTAVQCIRQLKLGAHDILILDDSLLWGGVDGILWWIADTVPSDEEPRIIISGVDPPAKLSSRTGVDVQQCLQKPYRLLTILEAVTGAQRKLEERRSAVRQFAEYNDGLEPIDQTGRRVSNPRHLPADIAVKVRGTQSPCRELPASVPMTEATQFAEMTVCGIKDVVNGVAEI